MSIRAHTSLNRKTKHQVTFSEVMRIKEQQQQKEQQRLEQLEQTNCKPCPQIETTATRTTMTITAGSLTLLLLLSSY